MKAETVLITVGACFLLVLMVLAGALIFGGPQTPSPLPSINAPFQKVDFSTLPPLAHFAARDGSQLAFRAYTPPSSPKAGSIVLIHGSSGQSTSMHAMAQVLAQSGYPVYALDIRGHGASGPKGTIAYVGQLEDDLEDFIRAITPAQPTTLVGFSSGGGFAIRFAGSARQTLFQHYVFLSPFISQDAPTYRANGGGWVSVGVPRIIALSVLNAAGIHMLNDLVVTEFALNAETKKLLTPTYSFSLASNFRPLRDYVLNIQSIQQPCQLIAGTEDELFQTNQFQTVFQDAGKKIPITLIPGINHIQLTLDPHAIAVTVQAIHSLHNIH